jgi:8-oxo-dGTP diphosphatase
MAMEDVIRAAGVVLLRGEGAGVEALIVHRPGRSDWSLPKGKVDIGEHVIEAAVRECDEETGFTPILGAPLPSQSYSVMSRPKVVNYWSATIRVEDGFAPDEEIDEIRWVPVGEVADCLTYPADAALVAQAAARPPTTPLVILRHTQAVKRSDFSGDDDRERPLSGRGRSQSKELVPLLDAFGVTTIHSSTSRRCTDTVRRLAKQLDTKVVGEPALTEESHRDHPNRAAKRIRELALLPEGTVICSHRPVLPTVLEAVAEVLDLDRGDHGWGRIWDPKLPPGGFLVVHRAFDADGSPHVVGIERHTPSRA